MRSLPVPACTSSRVAGVVIRHPPQYEGDLMKRRRVALILAAALAALTLQASPALAHHTARYPAVGICGGVPDPGFVWGGEDCTQVPG